jgi:tryptophan halogenase
MSIVVAGAGTAGWLTALYTQRHFPHTHITIVYDDKTPIIGVGESTTPNFKYMMDDLNIPVEDLVKECEVTIKNSIKFTNWKGDGSFYHHSFFRPDDDNVPITFFNALKNGIPLDDVDPVASLANSKKVQCVKNDVDNPGSLYEGCGYAYHFNAKLMSEYLHKIGVKRGIKTVVGKIEDVVQDNNGYVTEIVLDTKQVIKTDFIFDCTGFARLFVGKTFKSPIKSYEKELPTKRAMPFFLEKLDTTPSYTEAIAMKYGWMWKIPVGKRYGCGYVFDSDLITDEEAYKEICEITKQKPHVPRKLTFKPEYHINPFNKNTLALGLSHGFLEPLEATSLLILNYMLHVLKQSLPGNDLTNISKREEYTKDYNSLILNFVENCVDFVHIHYLTPRNDTEFWKKFKTITPERVSRKLLEFDNYDTNRPNGILFERPFTINNMIQCISGVDCVKKETIERNSRSFMVDYIKKIKERVKNICELSKNHDDYLNEISNT